MAVYRQKWQRDQFERMGQGVGMIDVPLLGTCQIKVVDGKAVLLPQSGGGVITREWFSFCGWQRRRRQPSREYVSFERPGGIYRLREQGNSHMRRINDEAREKILERIRELKNSLR